MNFLAFSAVDIKSIKCTGLILFVFLGKNNLKYMSPKSPHQQGTPMMCNYILKFSDQSGFTMGDWNIVSYLVLHFVVSLKPGAI